MIAEKEENNGMWFSATTISVLMCNLLGIWNLNHDQNVATCQWLQAIGQAVMGNQAIVDGMAWPQVPLQTRTSVSAYLPTQYTNSIIIILL